MSGIFLSEVKDCSIFKEIALNIVNQLEILREAISNSDDANADKIYITIERDIDGEFMITIQDNGLGTKIFYKSNYIYIETNNREGNSYLAIMKNSWETLEQGNVPKYEIKEC